MVKSSNKSGDGANPEAQERRRLKKLAFSKSILSETPARPTNLSLSPSKTVAKHHGKDILKKSHRKNRFLFSFPGLLAPISGGKIGELKDLGTKNPILYLDFPQGQMKLFGTIIYPKNRYLTLQFSRGGKNVMCEDCFDTMIVFSDAWWIGKKDENPDEARLEFPKELAEGQPAEYDFKGGAGATATLEINQGASKSATKNVEELSPYTDEEDFSSKSENNEMELLKATPTRHSARTAGKTFRFAEVSPNDDSVDSGAESPEGEDKKTEKNSIVLEIDRGTAGRTHLPEQIPVSTMPLSKSDKVSKSSVQVIKPEEKSHSSHGSLVQTTISTLFKNVEKKEQSNLRKTPSPKVSGQKLRQKGLKRKLSQTDEHRKKGKVSKEKDAGIEIMTSKKEPEDLISVEPKKVYRSKAKSSAAASSSTTLDAPASPIRASNVSIDVTSSQDDDDIKEFSSSQDADGSDEDWIGD